MFYLLLPDAEARDRYIAHMKDWGVMAVFHYQDLARSRMSERLNSTRECPNAQQAADRLVRLPLYASLTRQEQDTVIAATREFVT
jgi:dTDP-4-amino-4,6-dideoxygalactose transaminase